MLNVIVFLVNDDEELKRSAVALSSALGDKVKVVDMYSRSLSDLLLVASHRVVSCPTVVVVRGKETIGRFLRIPDAEELSEILS